MSAIVEKDEKGRWVFTRGKYEGEYLDDVATTDKGYLRFVLKNFQPKDVEKAITDALDE